MKAMPCAINALCASFHLLSCYNSSWPCCSKQSRNHSPRPYRHNTETPKRPHPFFELLERNETRRVRRTDTGTTVLDRLAVEVVS